MNNGLFFHSTNPSKFGFKVLKWYTDRSKDVTPINPTTPVIEGRQSVASVDKLSDPTNTAISVITPPSITLQVLKDAKALNIPYVWIQPGAEDANVIEFVKQNELPVIYGGPCILVSGDGILEKANKL